MSTSKASDPILKGRTADPALRQGIPLVDYPEYLVADALGGDGLQEAHRRMGSENLSPEAAARTITEMIVERLANGIPEGSEEEVPARKDKPRASFVPHISARFPRPVISKMFGKKSPVHEEPIFDDDAAPIDFASSVAPSLLMRAEAVSRLWRRGEVSPDRAAHLLEVAVEEYREHKRQ